MLAQRGDLSSLATLFQRHRAGLYAAAVALLGDRDEAADMVQDTFVAALTHLGAVRNPAAVRGWLHTVLRNACRMRLRRVRPAVLEHAAELVDPSPDPEQLIQDRWVRDRIWTALSTLSDEERITLVLRHFTRSGTYRDIAEVTGVPLGTVRSRLHRAHARLADALDTVRTDCGHDQRALEADRRAAWTDFYRSVHEQPEARIYRRMFAPDVTVRDIGGSWAGIDDWVAEERSAVELGVRATVIGVTACPELTVLEIDFTNPPEAPDHCPPRSTFVHRLRNGRTADLVIHYV